MLRQLAFLWLNDWRLNAGEDELADLVIGVASGKAGKADAAVFIQAHLVPAARS